MKFFTYIFILLFLFTGFFPDTLVLIFEKAEFCSYFQLLGKKQSESEKSFPMDWPANEKKSESKDSSENSESSDVMNDLFSNSNQISHQLFLSDPHYNFVRFSILSAFDEIFIPPPEVIQA